jgi:hypothetical protein
MKLSEQKNAVEGPKNEQDLGIKTHSNLARVVREDIPLQHLQLQQHSQQEHHEVGHRLVPVGGRRLRPAVQHSGHLSRKVNERYWGSNLLQRSLLVSLQQ